MTSSAENAARSVARARELARKQPASAELLTFYADLTEFIQTPRVTMLEAIVPALLAWLTTHGTPALAERAHTLANAPSSFWFEAVEEYRDAGGDLPDQTATFIVEVALQTLIASGIPADRFRVRPRDTEARSGDCPHCGGRAVVASLTERGHGASRSLVCGLCQASWPVPRIECPACGEVGFEALPVYSAEEFPGIRIDACQRCQTYIKTIDLTVSGAAIPVVDDLASLPLDLWAAEQGFRKLRKNLLRM